ncbi:endonuclease/exonuclease/phosphatase family protein [Salinisphaera sp. Q1T1-3]|uniref:endonuclease/exonuclease/phosphatase family protein n=1 Tax=Salinisphaera sp. Q1T1-3 TaxID=2321229 RepID=UPI000E72EA62|nr:endonuclease/exonuclease/phosphatase family protein [Salinisphaera sp. Q1T1-3]RJS92871.1 EEP domain-containing protein [Salinisphaera sp. Q1T1-3]
MSRPGLPNELSILSFNMQVGIGTRRYREYVTRGWRHLLPSQAVTDNLERIAELVAGHDIVGLQEIDAGSRRSRYRNQIEAIARQAGYAYWEVQVNRDLGRVAQHGLGLISRYAPYDVSEHKLPGRVPGRGALIARFGTPAAPLTVVVTHLSLGARSRAQQLEAICELVADEPNVVLMGDTNCNSAELIADSALAASALRVYDRALPTFPSWRPRRGIDHILTSASLEVRQARVVDAVLSDHRPVAMRVGIPDNLARGLAGRTSADAASLPQK